MCTSHIVEVRRGDIVHVVVGKDNMGDGMLPFIPDEDKLEEVANTWRELLPEGIEVHVTADTEWVSEVIRPEV